MKKSTTKKTYKDMREFPKRMAKTSHLEDNLVIKKKIQKQACVSVNSINTKLKWNRYQKL